MLLFRVVKDGRHIFPELPNFIKSEGVHRSRFAIFSTWYSFNSLDVTSEGWIERLKELQLC